MWVIMLKRRGEEKRRRGRLQAKRDIPRTGDPISVTEDDGTRVRGVIVGTPHYKPSDKNSLASYTVDADEI